MPEGQVLEFTHVTKRFGAVTAVSDLSARVEPGVVTAFLGPNGAGKTTTLRILLGHTRASSGTATIGGTPYAELRQPLRVIGSVLEETPYRPRRTASRHLSIAAKANGIPLSRIDEVLAIVGLHGESETRIGGYSLGMRQRLSVATALLGDPGALVFDEPANGLDPEGIRWMRLLMRRLADEGRTVLVSSHVLSEVEQVADHVLVLSKGQLVLSSGIEKLADPSAGTVVVDADDRAALTSALSAAGLDFEVLRSGLTVRGSDAGQVGAVAASSGIALTTLQQRGPTLEDVFIELVRGGSFAPRAVIAAVGVVESAGQSDADAAATGNGSDAGAGVDADADAGIEADADADADADLRDEDEDEADAFEPEPAPPEAVAAVAAAVDSGAAAVGAPSFDEILFGTSNAAVGDDHGDLGLADAGAAADASLDGDAGDPVAPAELAEHDGSDGDGSDGDNSDGDNETEASDGVDRDENVDAADRADVSADGGVAGVDPIDDDATRVLPVVRPVDETPEAADDAGHAAEGPTEGRPAEEDTAEDTSHRDLPAGPIDSDDTSITDEASEASASEESDDHNESDDDHSGIEIFASLDEDDTDEAGTAGEYVEPHAPEASEGSDTGDDSAPSSSSDVEDSQTSASDEHPADDHGDGDSDGDGDGNSAGDDGASDSAGDDGASDSAGDDDGDGASDSAGDDDPRSAAVSSMLAAAARAYFNDEPKDYPFGQSATDEQQTAPEVHRETWAVASTGVIETVPRAADAEGESSAADEGSAGDDAPAEGSGHDEAAEGSGHDEAAEGAGHDEAAEGAGHDEEHGDSPEGGSSEHDSSEHPEAPHHG